MGCNELPLRETKRPERKQWSEPTLKSTPVNETAGGGSPGPTESFEIKSLSN